MKDQKFSVEALFGQELKKMRGSVSQRELAERMVAFGHVGWLQSTVAKTETAENARPLRLDEFVTLCLALGEQPDEVLNKLQRPLTENEVRAVELRARARELERQIEGNNASIAMNLARVAEQRHELETLRQQLNEVINDEAQREAGE